MQGPPVVGQRHSLRRYVERPPRGRPGTSSGTMLLNSSSRAILPHGSQETRGRGEAGGEEHSGRRAWDGEYEARLDLLAP